MILFSWGAKFETGLAWPTAPLRGWRWTFQAERWTLGFIEQIKWPDLEWDDNRRFYVTLWSRWLWGFSHVYYDGNHCALHLGFLHIYWEPLKCERCMPREACR